MDADKFVSQQTRKRYIYAYAVIPILYEDAPNYMSNEPHSLRVFEGEERKERKVKKYEFNKIWRSFTKKWYWYSFA